MEEEDGILAEDAIFEPQLLASFNHNFGDVNEIQFAQSDVMAVASSDGSVTLLRMERSTADGPSTGFKLTNVYKWEELHSCCNSLSIEGDNIVSVGSDGKLTLLSGRKGAVLKSFKHADSGTINSALFLKQTQVAAANTRGQVKIWDLRSAQEVPSKVCHLAMDLVGISSITRHPTQPHVLVGGGTNGVLAFWDLRGSQDYPLSVVKAHSDAVSEVHFHDQQPDHLFSCSQNGDVWHWNASQVGMFRNPAASVAENNCVWLNSELVKNRVDTKPLMAKQSLPVNSMSIQGSSVLVAGDSEAIFVIGDIGL